MCTFPLRVDEDLEVAMACRFRWTATRKADDGTGVFAAIMGKAIGLRIERQHGPQEK